MSFDPSSTTNRGTDRAADAAAVHSFLLSPNARNTLEIAQQSSNLTVPPDHLVEQYWDQPRSTLTKEQTALYLEAKRYQAYVKDLQEGMKEQEETRESLLLRKHEAEAFLRTVDNDVVKAEKIFKLLANKKISALSFLSQIFAKKETVDFLLTYSDSKPFAKMVLAAIRAKLGMEHAGKVNGLSYLACIAMLYILKNMNLELNKDFKGDHPSEDNDFKGVILTGKGDTSHNELKHRIMSYLKVPPAPLSGAPPQVATAHNVGRAAVAPPIPALAPRAVAAAPVPALTPRIVAAPSVAALALGTGVPTHPMTKQEKREALLAELAKLDEEETEENPPPAKTAKKQKTSL